MKEYTKVNVTGLEGEVEGLFYTVRKGLRNLKVLLMILANPAAWALMIIIINSSLKRSPSVNETIREFKELLLVALKL